MGNRNDEIPKRPWRIGGKEINGERVVVVDAYGQRVLPLLDRRIASLIVDLVNENWFLERRVDFRNTMSNVEKEKGWTSTETEKDIADRARLQEWNEFRAMSEKEATKDGEKRYAVPHVGQFSDRAEELWKDMRDHVLRLAARYGEDAVNKAGPRWFAEVDVKNGKVSFQGTTDDIAMAVDEITEKLEG